MLVFFYHMNSLLDRPELIEMPFRGLCHYGFPAHQAQHLWQVDAYVMIGTPNMDLCEVLVLVGSPKSFMYMVAKMKLWLYALRILFCVRLLSSAYASCCSSTIDISRR